MIVLRNDGRTFDQVRPISITYDLFGYADASILFEIGQTKVLVSAMLQSSGPHFLRGRGTGWLTAEYAMLPSATRTRTFRESSAQKRSNRSIEISRLIGRSLRSVVDLDCLGERAITVDCDVLQADGGTRSACITAASLVLNMAQSRWLQDGVIKKSFLKSSIAAISVGVVCDQLYLDISQEEDNRASVDFNFVLTELGDIVEIQGTSEKSPMSWEDFEQVKKLALSGIEQLFKVSSRAVKVLQPKKVESILF
ncbi:ribonuclease PH [Candidatus Dependentiae bacterium]|nr:ribonuclease PH [Candidatus Dependentiae bacterium]